MGQMRGMLGADIADHECRSHGRRGEDGALAKAGERAGDDDADEDDPLAPAIEDRVHERAEPARIAGGARERAVEHVEDATEQDDKPPRQPELLRNEGSPDDRDPKTDQRQGIRRQAEPAHSEGDRLEDLLHPGSGVVRNRHRLAGEAEHGALPCRELGE